MDGGRRGPNKLFELDYGEITAVASESTVIDLNVSLVHCFAGVQFFEDADGATPVLPTAGTISVYIKTINNDPNFEPAPYQVIEATAPDTMSWAANTLAVKAVPAGITGAAYYRLVVTCNET